MRKAQRFIFLGTLILTCYCLGVRSQSIPELPRSTLANVSPAVRDQMQAAYADARAHVNDSDASGRLGMVFQTYGLFEEAARFYGRAARLAPSAFRWAYYLGVVEAAQGHCDKAASALRTAVSLDANYVPAELQLANCLLTSADWNGSEELYAGVIKRHPDNAEAYYGLGRVRAARHDFAGAVEAYSQACALFPDFGPAHYALALVERRLGQTGQADEQLRLYERNSDRFPPSSDPLLDEVRALNRSATYQIQVGIELEKQGQLEESVAANEKALEINPQLVQAHVNLVELYGRLGQFEKAEEHYRAASHLDPGSSESYYNYGVLLLSAEKYQQAESAFRKTIEIDPFQAGAHNNLGFLLERQGRGADAVAEYRKAIENRPDDRQAHFNLGRVLVNLGKYQEGIQELKKTIKLEDENTPRYIYALGAAFARSGDRENALRYIRQAREGALALGQSRLVDSIDRDLRTLEMPRVPQ
jgi:tetratricopeptide (TPR) repeat protein